MTREPYWLVFLLIGERGHQAWTFMFHPGLLPFNKLAENIAIRACMNWSGKCEWWAFGPDGDYAEGHFKVDGEAHR